VGARWVVVAVSVVLVAAMVGAVFLGARWF